MLDEDSRVDTWNTSSPSLLHSTVSHPPISRTEIKSAAPPTATSSAPNGVPPWPHAHLHPLHPRPAPPSSHELKTRRGGRAMLRLHSYPPLASLTQPPTKDTSDAVPRRPAVILPGLGNNTGDYKGLAFTLKSYGVPSVVAEVSRVDWLRNAAGLVDANYWKGTLRPRPVLDWYLKRVEDAISEAKQIAEDGSLTLIGHSAGGWLARLCMEEFGTSNISLLLTLGTPHLPPPKDIPGVIDQTRGLMNYVENYCKPAVYSSKLKYVCIAGRYIRGARFVENMKPAPVTTNVSVDLQSLADSAAVDDRDTARSGGVGKIRARIIGQGYKQVCGRADVWGDGVVPEVSAHLEGALNISYEGVYHSPVGSDDIQRPWYGSPAVVEKWIHHLLD